MSKLIELSPVEYAKLRNLTPAAVTKAIRKAVENKKPVKLVGVKRVGRIFRFHRLHCNIQEIEDYMQENKK
jgi:hypothetical protein